ncbi:MAG: glycosyltransferase, partial [Elusimicrobiota bacterium]
GIPEAATDGYHGLLVPPGEPEALAGAICRLASDPALRQRLGQAARQRIAHDFSIMSMIAGYEASYREVLRL